MKIRFITLYRNIRAFHVAIIPLAALFLFIFIFYKHYSFLEIDEMHKNAFIDSGYVDEFKARTIWGLSSVFLFVIVSISTLYSVLIIIQNAKMFNDKMWRIFVISMILILILFVIGYIFYEFNISGGTGLILLCSIEDNYFLKVNNFINHSMVFSAFCVFLTTIAMGTILFRPINSDKRDLLRRLRQYKISIYITTVFLIAGILQVFSLYRWSILSYDDLKDPQDAIKLADSLALSGSIVYTIVFLLMFIPVSVILGKWAKQIAIANTNTFNEIKIEKWMKNEGLYRSPKRVFAGFLMLVTPSLISILFEIITPFIKEQ